MNLEDVLGDIETLNSTNTMTQQKQEQTIQEQLMQQENPFFSQPMQQTVYQQPVQQPVQQPMQQPVQQPVYQQPVINESATNDGMPEVDVTKYMFNANEPQKNSEGLPRLVGQVGESFRLHILPTPPFRLHTHYNSKKGRNFVCLKDLYQTSYEDCCTTHGYAKPRNVIPVLVYPTVQGNINALIPNVVPELSTLVINDKKLDDIKQAAMSVTGKSLDQINLDDIDIIARTDNPQYKSHIFNCTPTSMKDQVAQYIPGLVEKWKQMATSDKILGVVGGYITREIYKSDPEFYSYDYRKQKQEPDTPTQGVAPSSYTINQPIPQNGYQQPYGPGSMPPGQPFYGNINTNFQQPTYNGNQGNNPDPFNSGKPWI